MSRKNLLLGGVLIVLLAIAYIYQGPYQEWKQSGKKGGDLLSNIKTVEEVTGVEIRKGTTTVTTLEKGEEGWKLADSKEFYIKESNEDDLKGALESLFQDEWEVVSTNPDSKKEFQTGENGTHFILSTDNKEESLVVGKTGPDFQSSYLSFPDSSKTYLADSNISDLANVEQWGDPIIFDTDKENITELRFQYPDNEFTVTKEEEKWRGTVPYNFSVDQEKIKEVLNVMTDLTAADIPKQTFEGTGLGKHLIIVEAGGEESNTLMVGENNKEGLYYAKKAKSDNIYLITEEQRNKLKRSISDLRQ